MARQETAREKQERWDRYRRDGYESVWIVVGMVTGTLMGLAIALS
ncbi:MAG: hypothetical protein ACI8RZ_001203 [Myxococcota bacterium]|jgi:hypothetical protein